MTETKELIQQLSETEPRRREAAYKRLAENISMYDLDEMKPDQQQETIWKITGHHTGQDLGALYSLHVSPRAFRPVRQCDADGEDFDPESPVLYKVDPATGDETRKPHRIYGEMECPADTPMRFKGKPLYVLKGKLTLPAKVAINLYQRFGHKADDEDVRNWLVCDSKKAALKKIAKPESFGDDKTTGSQESTGDKTEDGK